MLAASTLHCVAVLLFRDEVEWATSLKTSIVILVATLPVAMPLVVTTALAVGSYELSREKAIVQRLSAIEEMAGMDILCSDKTGTLTTYWKLAAFFRCGRCECTSSALGEIGRDARWARETPPVRETQ